MKDIYNILIADKCSEIVESICRILDDDDDYGWNISIVNSGKQ
jgi:hypothetical protein